VGRGDIRPAIAPAGRLNTALGIAYAAATAAAQKAEPVSSNARNPITSVDIQLPTRETSSPANNVRIVRFRHRARTGALLAMSARPSQTRRQPCFGMRRRWPERFRGCGTTPTPRRRRRC